MHKHEEIITFLGQPAKINCDGNCRKAWGINTRPKKQLSDNEDDYAFLSDNELGNAPDDPGTYEGGCGKPHSAKEFPTKWCVRECERCTMSLPGESDQPLTLKNFGEPYIIYNEGNMINNEKINTIPPITDPLGSGWDQPSPKNILIDDTHAMMSAEDEKKLLVYNGTFPTGVYDGKMFKSGSKLVWFSDNNGESCANNYREIVIVD